MFPSKFLQFPSILTHFHAANEKIQNGGCDLAISRGLVWVNACCVKIQQLVVRVSSSSDHQGCLLLTAVKSASHDDVIKWKHFPHYWPFVRGVHRSLLDYPHKGHWRRALMLFCLMCTWTNSWANSRDAGYLRHHYAHCDIIVMHTFFKCKHLLCQKMEP